MPRHNTDAEPPIEARDFRSTEEIDSGIVKLRRRIDEVSAIDAVRVAQHSTGEDSVVSDAITETIREVFGTNSPELRKYGNLHIWAGSIAFGMSNSEIVEGIEKGKELVRNKLAGLINRLEEKRADLEATDGTRPPESYYRDLDLHPRIAAVATQRFLDGYPWDAVFNASKTLVNYVREKSECYDLDGAGLMRTVFSKNDAVLAFNDRSGRTEEDEQEGLMHLFEGAVLAIRNPGGHGFPEGPPERAIEYLELLSLLAYRVDNSKKVK